MTASPTLTEAPSAVHHDEHDVEDADGMLSRLDELTLTDAERKAKQKRNLHLEEVTVSKAILSQPRDSRRNTAIQCYATALEGLNKRALAIHVLTTYLEDNNDTDDNDTDDDDNNDGTTTSTNDLGVRLLLAKLLFKDNQTQNARVQCDLLISAIRIQQQKTDNHISHTNATKNNEQEEEVFIDAFHLAGWLRIHADDHTDAYRIWEEGYVFLPNCEILRILHDKRNCWDLDSENIDDAIQCTIESSSNGSSQSNNDNLTRATTPTIKLDRFRVPPSLRHCTPALALFDSVQQDSALVMRSQSPVLSQDECAWVLQELDEHHQDEPWSTVRHASVHTTDVAVEDVPALRPWLRTLLKDKLYPLLAQAFPVLADGTTIGPRGERMRVHDAFIVRYDTDAKGVVENKSCSLPEHSDTSSMSFTISLNQQGTDGDFVGGGTWFEALGGEVVAADCGHAVAFAGPLRHAGYPVTSGCRMIVVLFLYIEDYAYGHFLEEYAWQKEKKDEAATDEDSPEATQTPVVVKPSGDTPGGFVVYNQTVELTSMLNRSVASVLD